jgi:hypothetical protein
MANTYIHNISLHNNFSFHKACTITIDYYHYYYNYY